MLSPLLLEACKSKSLRCSFQLSTNRNFSDLNLLLLHQDNGPCLFRRLIFVSHQFCGQRQVAWRYDINTHTCNLVHDSEVHGSRDTEDWPDGPVASTVTAFILFLETESKNSSCSGGRMACSGTISDYYCTLDIVCTIYDNYMYKCEGHYENNIKYECENKNYFL
jgi:hypothetical protein